MKVKSCTVFWTCAENRFLPFGLCCLRIGYPWTLIADGNLNIIVVHSIKWCSFKPSIMTRNIHWIFSFLFCLFVYVLEAWNNCTVQEILLLYVPGVLVNLVLLDWILKMSGPSRFFELDLRVENKTSRAHTELLIPKCSGFFTLLSKFYAREASYVIVLPEYYFGIHFSY